MPVEIHLPRFDEINRNIQREMTRSMRRGLRVVTQRFLRDFTNRRLKRPGSASLAPRTGALRRSFRSDVLGRTLADMRGRVYSAGVPYAVVHEEGRTIRPRRRQWLTIPLSAVKTPAGVPRGDAEDYRTGAATKPRVDRTFVAQSRDGRLFIVGIQNKRRGGASGGQKRASRRRGRGKTPRIPPSGSGRQKVFLLFRLVKQVRIKPRLNLRRDWQAYLPIARQTLQTVMHRQLAGRRL